MPTGCSASPTSDDNLFVWTATVFGPDGKTPSDHLPAPFLVSLSQVAATPLRAGPFALSEIEVIVSHLAFADSPWEGGIFCLR